jgi:hypothetical protein
VQKGLRGPFVERTAVASRRRVPSLPRTEHTKQKSPSLRDELFCLARQSEYGSNDPYLIDFFPICISVKLLNCDEIRDLYEKAGLTTVQIARTFGVARTVIASRLRNMGVLIDRPHAERTTNPHTYRMRVPPYGYSVQNGKLVPKKSELKICRLVVELIQRQGWRQNAVAREFSRRGYRNRAGKQEWNSKTIFNIYRRRKDRL